MSTRRGVVVAIGLVAAVGAGCATHDEPAPAHGARAERTAVAPTPGDCSGRVDALITRRIIPNSDREYAIGMCQAHR